jgi:hypothetical protein
MYLRVLPVAAAVLFSSATAFAQHLSYGVVAGTALTDDFNSFYLPFQRAAIIQKSGGKGVIVGPMLEWNFSQHFSLQADGLFRELRFEDFYGGAHNPTVTWEFPILAKYRLFSFGIGRSALRPFVEAGPSFRTTGNLNANPSHSGVSAGGGLDFRFRQLNVAPTLRYTRWAEDAHPFGIQSRPDQLELLVGFSHTADSDLHPFGQRLSMGAVMGTNLLGDYNSTMSTEHDVISGNQITFSSSSGPRSFVVGPAVEFRATDDFSLEADAVYRPIREHHIETLNVGSFSHDSSLITWQFPLLAKYRFRLPLFGNNLRAFFEAGPSFRIGDSATHFGFTAGIGVSAHVGPLSIAPAIRYMRWQADPFGQIKSNETDLVVGFTF